MCAWVVVALPLCLWMVADTVMQVRKNRRLKAIFKRGHEARGRGDEEGYATALQEANRVFLKRWWAWWAA